MKATTYFFILAYVLLLFSFSLQADHIAILSWYGYISQEVFFSDEVNKPYLKLQEILHKNGHTCAIAEGLEHLNNADHIIFFNIQLDLLKQIKKKYPKKNRILFLWEPVVVDTHNYNKKFHRYFSQVLTWDDDLLKDISYKKYQKFYYVADDLVVHKPLVSFNKRRFCTLIASDKNSNHLKELYSKRRKAIEFFERYHPAHFEFYGRSWVPATYKTYKGKIPNKIDYLKHYKFCICYENMGNVKGYITEKIFDCFKAGCVPVYLGADNITDFIPKSCFIDRRDFKSHKHLYAFLKSITKKQFYDYIAHITAYCASKQASYFSIKFFADTLLTACGIRNKQFK